jgi:hypothetical protein
MSVRDLIFKHSDVPSGLRPILLAMLPEIEQPTLRDHFAMTALTIAASPESKELFDTIEADSFESAVAKAAYRIADAMLKQREEGRDNEN